MKIKIEKISDFSILKIDGKMDISNSATVESEIEKLFTSGEKNIIFNCNDLNYISSSGLRVFLIAKKKAVAGEVKLYICNLSPDIRNIFDISGFSNIFSIFNSQEEIFEH
jgi:anti-anti-sigma factor